MTPVTTVQRMNRYELKYVVDYRAAGALLDDISARIRSDGHADRRRFYKVVSLYYDSPDLACYREKLDGEKFRRKVRVRTYGDVAAEAFVEIKQRLNLNVQKRRLKAPLTLVEARMRAICAGRGDAVGEPVFDEVQNLYHRYRLQPQVTVSYNRAAFFALDQKDLRITLDRNIRCRRAGASLAVGRHRGVFALSPRLMVLEVKFNELLPRWLANCLNAMDFQIQRVSKYCYGVERLGLAERGV